MKPLRAVVNCIELVCQWSHDFHYLAVSVDKADTSADVFPARTVEALCTVRALDCHLSNDPGQSSSSSAVSVYMHLLRCKCFLTGSDVGSNASHSSVCECSLVIEHNPSSYTPNYVSPFPLKCLFITFCTQDGLREDINGKRL